MLTRRTNIAGADRMQIGAGEDESRGADEKRTCLCRPRTRIETSDYSDQHAIERRNKFCGRFLITSQCKREGLEGRGRITLFP